MAASTADDYVRRLLEGMAASITEKGYAATTIADIVRRARVSKRTFYEHFADKEAAFLATYSAASDEVLAVIAEAIASDAPWRDRVAAGVRAYLSELAAHPALTRTFLVEIQAAGPRALALRRDVMRRFAASLQAVVEDLRRTAPDIPPLSETFAIAAVGAINELLLQAIESGRADRLEELADDASALLYALIERRG